MLELAATFYRQAAKVSARNLATSPVVESVLVHRSVATGEVSFGRSDIDLLLVIGQPGAEDGAKIASLYRKVRLLRVANPALNHIEVFEPDGIAGHARMDTFWGSMERRSASLLLGKPVEFPSVPVQPDHAVSRFLLWMEWFFALSLQRRSRRNLRKTSLESWNAYATADGLIPEPYLLRREMEAHVERTEDAATARRLEDPSCATRFVFGLADRLHRPRLPALGTLARPLVFETILAPLALRRRFVVLPRADYPLPPETFAPGSFPCTPETLHLYLHYKNAFLYWALPPELLNLGMKPPGIGEFLRDCRYYNHNRFLCLPGFADSNPPSQAVRFKCIRHTLEWAERGELPPAIPPEKLLGTPTGTTPITDYYRSAYDAWRCQSQQLQESLNALVVATE